MHPVLADFFFPVYTYGTLVAAAFLIGLKITTDRARRRGWDPAIISNLFLFLLASSIVGARLLYVLSNAQYFLARPLEILMVQRGGLSYFGGFLGAVAAGVCYARKKSMPFLELADVFVPALALGQAIGRLGCYFNGCCYGVLYDGWGALYFPAGSPAFVDQVNSGWISPQWPYAWGVFPVQLLSSLADLLLFVLLVAIDDRKKNSGQTFFAYLAGYGVLRFLLEFLRGDNVLMAGGLTGYQWISLGIFTVGLAGLLGRRRHAR